MAQAGGNNPAAVPGALASVAAWVAKSLANIKRIQCRIEIKSFCWHLYNKVVSNCHWF
jgi:hypothetical protein